ncbi:MAG TPA: GTP 3',8-cyclase MoaA [Planctomycetes bacterium]|nr:GTP 3',8-cyclase MoaA [Planctomycetota bacterium]HIN80666.1 GTP 3',8-cyclase MoaA [Planctomycetota bacterium]
MPLDQFDREIDYLRISVMDRCNLRCTYCMPLEGLRFLPPDELLTAEEISKIASAAIDVGFRKFRITGGEPTLRRDLVEIIAGIRSVAPDADLSMTTNGVLLPRLAADLASVGLDRVNIHLDSLDEKRVRQVMRRGELERFKAGIVAAEDAGLTPIKINTVVVAGVNDEDVVELARCTLDRPWHVRFIELMPMGEGESLDVASDALVESSDVKEMIEMALGPLEEVARTHLADECLNYRLADGRGIVGFISPVSNPFCASCNRMRLSADGRLLLCLLRDEEKDLRQILRRGGDLQELRSALLAAVEAKPVGHQLAMGLGPRRRMHQVGG